MEELALIKPDEYCSRKKHHHFIMECTEKGISMSTGNYYEKPPYSLYYSEGIKSCFDYYINFWGFSNEIGHFSRNQLSIIIYSLGGISVLFLVLIVIMWRQAWRKLKRLSKYSASIKDE